ncbi:hypothetical protein SAMN04487777_107130 [Priestia aryabhattai B8W22]|uniref:hypothetical protein n=1 Tax=Priestia aryabhattai TaxID=412384 RepID=UPI00088823E6|nr:hypothetical protein SAMN04487777_107130 [Priestia aryabhattai B8W22]
MSEEENRRNSLKGVSKMNWFREFTLRDGRKKRIKIEEWRTIQDEMRELGITEN